MLQCTQTTFVMNENWAGPSIVSIARCGREENHHKRGYGKLHSCLERREGGACSGDKSGPARAIELTRAHGNSLALDPRGAARAPLAHRVTIEPIDAFGAHEQQTARPPMRQVWLYTAPRRRTPRMPRTVRTPPTSCPRRARCDAPHSLVALRPRPAALELASSSATCGRGTAPRRTAPRTPRALRMLQ